MVTISLYGNPNTLRDNAVPLIQGLPAYFGTSESATECRVRNVGNFTVHNFGGTVGYAVYCNSPAVAESINMGFSMIYKVA